MQTTSACQTAVSGLLLCRALADVSGELVSF